MAAYFLNPASEAKLFKLFTFTERIIADFYETVRERQFLHRDFGTELAKGIVSDESQPAAEAQLMNRIPKVRLKGMVSYPYKSVWEDKLLYLGSHESIVVYFLKSLAEGDLHQFATVTEGIFSYALNTARNNHGFDLRILKGMWCNLNDAVGNFNITALPQIAVQYTVADIKATREKFLANRVRVIFPLHLFLFCIGLESVASHSLCALRNNDLLYRAV